MLDALTEAFWLLSNEEEKETPSIQAEKLIEKEPTPVTYYPSRKYLTEDLKPESSLTEEDVLALGTAARLGVLSKTLPAALGDYILPMAIVEGHSNNHGVKSDNQLYAKTATKERFKTMGLDIEDKTSAAYLDLVMNKKSGKLEPMILMNNSQRDPNQAARRMVAILADKAALQGKDTPEKAIKKYNGAGKAIEDIDGKKVPANVQDYWNKVEEAKRMLQHEKNRKIVELFMTNYNPKE
jgi:hypothetical protein